MNVKLKTHLFIFFLISVIPVCYINFGQRGTNYKKGLYKNVGTIIKKMFVLIVNVMDILINMLRNVRTIKNM